MAWFRSGGWSVSIPYSSGQCFFWLATSRKKIICCRVSIPYSSGQCFFYNECVLYSTKKEAGFNPLFIRSVFLFKSNGKFRNWFRQVSIPYSSGQCFFYSLLNRTSKDVKISFNPLFIRSVFLLRNFAGIPKSSCWRFQSLIHQVSVSFSLLNKEEEESCC